MYDIRNLKVWKEKEPEKKAPEGYLETEISELNLSVRSFNCLKRAGCHTVRDILDQLGEDGQGLKKIRNLGTRSEAEILESIKRYRNEFEDNQDSGAGRTQKKTTLIKPAKRVWDMDIASFNLSDQSLYQLRQKGIRLVGDLYETDPGNEPGWYAVRELFEKIHVN